MLASWDTLAESTGLGQGTMNAVTRPRIRTCLAISGLVDLDRALALVEVASHCNGTGNSNPRPIIGSVCKTWLMRRGDARPCSGAWDEAERGC